MRTSQTAITPGYSIIIPEETAGRPTTYTRCDSAEHSPEPCYMIASTVRTFER
jgi:hypothetical protein